MKTFTIRFVSALLATSCVSALAITRYVDLNSPNPTSPYTNWATAAANIQDAIDAAEPGDEVLVTNGVYSTGGRLAHPYQATNRVAIAKPLTVRSVNGPAVTIIQGYQEPGTIFGTNAVRCVYMTNDTMLAGFTLTNGSTRDLVYQDGGGGVRCESTSAIISNCVLIGNAAIYSGGGAWRGTLVNCTLAFNTTPYGNTGGYGGGASYAVLNNCLVISNSALVGAGGVLGCVVNDCTIVGNTAAGDGGGGASTSTLTNCTVTANSAPIGGGTYSGTVVASTISSNSATDRGGGAYGGDIQNSFIVGNTAPNAGGGVYGGNLRACVVAGNSAVNTNGVTQAYSTLGGGLYQANATNCTITGNWAPRGGGVYAGTLKNCIVYHNYAAKYSGFDNYMNSSLDYCCTTPRPASGAGNIVFEPQLLTASHLHANSPCLGAGSPGSISGTDIDGETWRNPPAIGCDEHYSAGLTRVLSVAIGCDYTNVGRAYPVNFAARIDGRPGAVRWDFGDGVVVSNRAYVTHGWTNAGAYQVVLTAYNDSFPGGISATTLVQVVDAVHYVSRNNSLPVAPYLSWATAATNIQHAIDAASIPGALVLVSNGLYNFGGRLLGGYTSNRVAVTKPLVIQSVNGPAVTTIYGSSTPRTRGAYLTNGAALSGFAIAFGSTSTAGDTWYDQAGGGVFCESSHAIITNCVITNCSAAYQGGGVNFGSLYHCVVSNNVASFYGGGVISSTLNNSLVASNFAGMGGGAHLPRATNCTIVFNRGGTIDGGGGVYGGELRNCIVLFNSSGNATSNYSGGDLSFCCTMPLPAGVGNFTYPPLFVNQAGRNFRLQSNSPCINSGQNSDSGLDLDFNPRIMGGTVDVGAYEFQSPSSVLSYAWAQQYGIATDGSGDFADADGDGMSNYAEWRADTNPTNALSVLRILTATKGGAGITVTWASVSTRSYWLERASNLGSAVPFNTVAPHINGAVGATSFTDTSATNAGTFFYRVGVR